MMNVDQLPAGRELDILVGQRVFGWVRVDDTPDDQLMANGVDLYIVPRYSTEIGAAWRVVQALNQQGYTLRLVGPEIPDTTGYLIEKRWSAAFVEPQYAFTNVGQRQGRGSTPSLAICRAALKVVAEVSQ